MTDTLYANKDSYVHSYYPNENFGSNTNLIIYAGGGTHPRRSFMGFDISSYPDADSISSAILYVYNENEVSSGTHDVKRIIDAWTEGGITWNNQPAVTATNSTTINITSLNTWFNVDVTNQVKDAASSGSYEVRFSASDEPDGSTAALLYSRTGTYPLYLLITYGSTKYVDIATGNDSDSGDTWALAYQTIKKGIDNSVGADNTLHVAEGDYSAQAAIDLDKNVAILCEDYGGGNASPPLTVKLPATV